MMVNKLKQFGKVVMGIIICVVLWAGVMYGTYELVKWIVP